jgi:hypothetical protein
MLMEKIPQWVCGCQVSLTAGCVSANAVINRRLSITRGARGAGPNSRRLSLKREAYFSRYGGAGNNHTVRCAGRDKRSVRREPMARACWLNPAPQEGHQGERTEHNQHGDADKSDEHGRSVTESK